MCRVVSHLGLVCTWMVPVRESTSDESTPATGFLSVMTSVAVAVFVVFPPIVVSSASVGLSSSAV